MEPIARRRLELGFALVLLAILITFFVISLAYPPRPRELPLLVDGIGIILVVVQLVKVFRSPSPVKKKGSPIDWRAVSLAFGSMLSYLILTYFIGMVLSSFVIVYGCGMAFGGKSKKKMAIAAALTVIGIYVLFVKLLSVPLYVGILFNG